jgi:hypothetical protein
MILGGNGVQMLQNLDIWMARGASLYTDEFTVGNASCVD